MPYSGQFIKISYLFTVAGTDEIADTAVNYTTAPGWTGAAAALAEIQTAALGADLVGSFNTLMGNSNLFWGNYSHLVGVKVAAKSTAGLDLAAPYVYEAVTDHVGGSTTTIPQSTVVLSLRSGQSFGKGNYGRMYLPHTRLGLVSGTPKSNEATTDLVVEAAVTWLNETTDDINGATTAILFPAIMSQAGSGQGKGVTSLAVGDVVDTQRRRRNRLTEVYSFADLA